MTADPKFPIAVDPAARPRRQRRASRVLLIDDQDRMLLFEDSDPLVPGSRWWLTPGGGIDPGETELEAAVREIAEETGFVITAAEFRGPIGRQVALHGFADVIIEQDEVFYLANVHSFEVDVAGHTEEERLTVLGHRWWTKAELAATADWLWPAQLPQLWEVAGRPADWPLELGHQEQSTVAV